MSPEQAKSADVDGRSDIFSLGAVLYEMITGQPPFRGDHPAAVVYAITSEDPEPLARFSRHVSPELQRIVSKALAKNPDERYQSALDLTADLRRERRDASTAALEPAARGRRRRSFAHLEAVQVRSCARPSRRRGG
jgi:serine/threonine-protein kinase